jgi:hypothetical protein
MKQGVTYPVQSPYFSWWGTEPGDGHSVVNFPGLGAQGHCVAALRAHCRVLGCDAFDWGQGFNAGRQPELAALWPRGPTLLEDFILREKITHFDHERIPERIVHARGSARTAFSS